MPSSYIQTVPPNDIQHLFDLVGQVLSANAEHLSLADIYSAEFGDPALGVYSLPQIRDQLQTQPIQLFALVSFLLSNPPAFLSNLRRREQLAQALTIPISDFERLRVTESGVWFREFDLDTSTAIQINRYE